MLHQKKLTIIALVILALLNLTCDLGPLTVSVNAPSATATPVPATQTPYIVVVTPTSAPTLTAVPSPTPVARTTTATPQGILALSEDFISNKNDWTISDKQPYTDEYGTFNERIGGGRLRLEVKAVKSFYARYRPRIIETMCSAADVCASYSDLHLTAEARRVSGSASTALYGLFFRLDDKGNFYRFDVRDSRQYRVVLRYQDEWTYLTNWTQTSAIHPGEVNRLEVTATGSHFVFSINNQRVGEIDNSQVNKGYKAGLIIAMDEGTEAVYEFTQFQQGVPSTVTAATPARPTAAPVPFLGGGKIAFVSSRTGGKQIFVMNADGSGVTRLTHSSPAWDLDPDWSPDGKKIVFVSKRASDRQQQIYVMNADGSGETRLTNDVADNWSPAWSPDGKQIAFETNDNGDQIYVMNADGSGETRLTTQKKNLSPTWSPDGKQIAFSSSRDGHDEIYVMNANGSNQTRITRGTVANIEPAWSPDGKKIAFASDRDGHWEIYVMNVDGSSQTRVTNGSDSCESPTWSPDGKRIAFTAGLIEKRIAVVNVDGSGLSRFTSSSGNDSGPKWQPSGSR